MVDQEKAFPVVAVGPSGEYPHPNITKMPEGTVVHPGVHHELTEEVKDEGGNVLIESSATQQIPEEEKERLEKEGHGSSEKKSTWGAVFELRHTAQKEELPKAA